MDAALQSRSLAEKQLAASQERVQQLETERTDIRSRLVQAESTAKQERLSHARVVAELKTQVQLLCSILNNCIYW